MSNNLYVIIPFFSFGNYELRKKNLEICLSNLKNFSNIHIIICEGVYQNKSLENESFIKNEKISYIKYELPSILWIKENLINLAINILPSNWQYMCWIDSDIIFLNNNWVNETIESLKINHVVQLYQTITYLDEDGNVDLDIKIPYHKPIMCGFIFKSIQEKKYVYGATGFGWGINRNLYTKINHFFEFNIIGGGDFTFSICVTQNLEYANTSKLFSEMPSKDYVNKLINYYNNFKQCKVSYIKGMICHLWHGNLNKRLYEPRLDILLKYKFSPDLHIQKNEKGIIYLTDKNLEKEIYQYFQSRKD